MRPPLRGGIEKYEMCHQKLLLNILKKYFFILNFFPKTKNPPSPPRQNF